MDILLESLKSLNESEVDTSSNEYSALEYLKGKLEDTGGWGLSFDPIEVNRQGEYEFAVRYWGSWEVPADIEDDEEEQDYDWKVLSNSSWNKLQEIISRVNSLYKVNIAAHTGEKCWIYFICRGAVNEAQTKLRYHYCGPVRHFQYVVADEWEGYTEAVSDRQALNNLTVKAKKELNFDITARVTLNPDYLELCTGEEDIPDEKFKPVQKCEKCGHELNDAGECPVCDLGDESVLESGPEAIGEDLSDSQKLLKSLGQEIDQLEAEIQEIGKNESSEISKALADNTEYQDLVKEAQKVMKEADDLENQYGSWETKWVSMGDEAEKDTEFVVKDKEKAKELAPKVQELRLRANELHKRVLEIRDEVKKEVKERTQLDAKKAALKDKKEQSKTTLAQVIAEQKEELKRICSKLEEEGIEGLVVSSLPSNYSFNNGYFHASLEIPHSVEVDADWFDWSDHSFNVAGLESYAEDEASELEEQLESTVKENGWEDLGQSWFKLPDSDWEISTEPEYDIDESNLPEITNYSYSPAKLYPVDSAHPEEEDYEIEPDEAEYCVKVVLRKKLEN